MAAASLPLLIYPKTLASLLMGKTCLEFLMNAAYDRLDFAIGKFFREVTANYSATRF
jgi:hypothetical protein